MTLIITSMLNKVFKQTVLQSVDFTSDCYVSNTLLIMFFTLFGLRKKSLRKHPLKWVF